MTDWYPLAEVPLTPELSPSPLIPSYVLGRRVVAAGVILIVGRADPRQSADPRGRSPVGR